MNRATPNIVTRLDNQLWQTDLNQLAMPIAWLYRITRIIVAVIRDMVGGQINLRAMGMVYSSLLSMVPLLAISFSLMKGLGVVDNKLEPMLLNLMAPMGAQGKEIATNILGFVNNVNAGALGTIGLVVLLWTVVSLLQKIETSFNFIWHVSSSRNIVRRFSDYFSVLLIGPLLVTAALGATGAALNNQLVQQIAGIEPFGTLLLFITKLTPYLLITAAFTFVYMFIANTRVKFSAAVVGALVAGLLWATIGKVFGMIFGSSSNTMAIYSSFAALILFLIWIYWSWLILLIGAQVAFYVQNPKLQRSGHKPQSLNADQHEYLTLALITLIGRKFVDGAGGCSGDELVEQTGLPQEGFLPTLKTMQKLGLLRRSQDEPSLWMLSRDPDHLSITTLINSLRSAPTTGTALLENLPAVTQIQHDLKTGAAAAVADITLRDLLTADPQSLLYEADAIEAADSTD
ncbi:MAG: ribonuclease BN [Gammaproteobacteria bacterium]|nr:MAG: ribonuclease BN [Gammaproteobacteria bacterium]RLA12898.1 MAG: ribonuclease BN [Gammaproteobacteria bacterium]